MSRFLLASIFDLIKETTRVRLLCVNSSFIAARNFTSALPFHRQFPGFTRGRFPFGLKPTIPTELHFIPWIQRYPNWPKRLRDKTVGHDLEKANSKSSEHHRNTVDIFRHSRKQIQKPSPCLSSRVRISVFHTVPSNDYYKTSAKL